MYIPQHMFFLSGNMCNLKKGHMLWYIALVNGKLAKNAPINPILYFFMYTFFITIESCDLLTVIVFVSSPATKYRSDMPANHVKA